MQLQKCTLHQFWDAGCKLAEHIKPNRQRRHLFAYLAISHLCMNLTARSTVSLCFEIILTCCEIYILLLLLTLLLFFSIVCEVYYDNYKTGCGTQTAAIFCLQFLFSFSTCRLFYHQEPIYLIILHAT
jgi:hypothetical protein